MIYWTLFAVCLSGCATYSWHHPSKGKEEAHKDEYACFDKAVKTFPYELKTQVDPVYPTMPCNVKDKQNNCEALIAPYTPPSTSIVDANQANRDRMVGLCMRSKGWVLSKDN